MKEKELSTYDGKEYMLKTYFIIIIENYLVLTILILKII